jgi:hypothetical protein
MAQLSRPYQIALGALALFALVWLLALRGHSGSSASSGSGSSAPAPTAAQQAKKAAASTSVYHGAAPGVEGLTKAIDKAHGAVAQSQQNEKQLQEKSAQASSPTSTADGAASTPASASTASVVTSARHGTSKPAGVTRAQPTPDEQVLVERALKENKIAVVLFWNKKGADDKAVQFELRLLEAIHHLIRPIAGEDRVKRALKLLNLEFDKKIAVFEADAKQVTSFGSITRGVQINQTPTILVINKRGQTTALTGLTDAYAIEQTIDEARHS